MRAHWRALPLLIPALAAAFVLAAPPSTGSHDLVADNASQRHEEVLSRRDGHDHGHDHAHGHDAPSLSVLNETEILLYHAPTPPSYWSIDLEDRQSGDKRYPGLMGLHIFFMSLAFFGALPVGACAALSPVLTASHGAFSRHRAAFGQACLAWSDRNTILDIRRTRIVLQRALQKVDS